MESKVAREIMREHQSGFVKLNPRWCAIDRLIEDSEKLEQIERQKGKWVTKFHGFPPEPYTTCSNCNYDIDFEICKLVKADAFTIKPYRPKYCPNCGAEMESEE